MRFSSRQIDRMLKRLGMKMEPVGSVSYVEIHKEDGEVIRIEGPEVAKLEVQGQTIFQVVGGEVTIAGKGEKVGELEIPEEDVELVARQAGVDKETARMALITVEGDLAKAIMMLRESSKTKKI